MMKTKGLYKPLVGTEEQPNEPVPLANGAPVVPSGTDLGATTLMLMRHYCLGDEG